MQNPFTLIFGKNPELSIARPEQTNKIVQAFTEETIKEPLFMLTGIRGSGKTVMMTDIANIIENNDDWIVIELNPNTEMLESFLSKLYSNSCGLSAIREAKIDLSFWGLGVSISAASPITDKETAVMRVLDALRRRNKRVLILIDEVVSNKNMKVFAGSFQLFVRKELPVCLLMTGLYENIEKLQNEDSLTFLHRAPKVILKPLNENAIARKYKATFSLDDSQAKEMSKMTKGYPFAFQVLGYLTWENGGDYMSAVPEFREYLEDYVYDRVWSELSDKDKRILSKIAACETSVVSDIRQLLSMTNNEFNPYRKRLIKKGVIDGSQRGNISIALPFFKEYVIDQMN